MSKNWCIFFKGLAIFLLFMGKLKAGYAQDTICNCTLHGKVYEADDKISLPGIHVYIKELAKGNITNENGYFEILHLCSGSYTLILSGVGYKTLHKTVFIQQKTELVIKLATEQIQLSSVIIETNSIHHQLTTPIYNLSSKETESGKSLGESLKNIAGVTTLQTGNSISKPIIHGLHSNRILIMNNGIKQEGQQWGAEHGPEIDPFIANRISVIKGAAGVRYGAEAIAGVILVEPAALPQKSRLAGAINLVGFSNGKQGVTSGYLEGIITKIAGLSWRLQGTLKKSGNTQAPHYYLANTGFQEENYSATLGYHRNNYEIEAFYSEFNTQLGILATSHIGNLTDLETAINSSQPLISSGFTYQIDRPYQDIKHQLFKAKGFVKISHLGKIHFTYGMQRNHRQEFDLHRKTATQLAALDFTLNTHNLEMLWEKYTKNWSSQVGINFSRQTNISQGVAFLIPNFRQVGAGIFLIEKWQKNKIEIEAGLRYDFKNLQAFMYDKNDAYITPKYTFNNVVGSIGTIYHWNDKISFNANIGMAWRPPTVNELFSNGVHHGAATYEEGNLNLKAEKAYKTIITWQYQGKKLAIALDAHANFMKDYIYLTPAFPAVLTIRGAFPKFIYTQTDAFLTGIDLSLHYKILKNLTWQVKGSTLRAKDMHTNKFLVLMPADRISNTFKYEWQKVGKLKDTYISLQTSSVNQQWFVPTNSDYKAPPKAYHLFGIEMGTKINVAGNLIDIGGGVANLFNTSYRDYLNRFRYYADDLGRNFTVHLKIPFTIN